MNVNISNKNAILIVIQKNPIEQPFKTKFRA